MRYPLSLEHLHPMLEYIRSEGEKLSVPTGRLQKLELAAEEALVNVISYGHPTPNDYLEIDCLREEGPHFVVKITDWGPAFNPIEADIDIQDGVSIDERKIGGLGIHLFRKLVDEASYVREGEANLLIFILRLEVA
jgi:serine/threonine-protein kinase RsbW